MYVIALANLYAWTGEERSLTRHWDTAQRILEWAREYGDSDTTDSHRDRDTLAADPDTNTGAARAPRPDPVH